MHITKTLSALLLAPLLHADWALLDNMESGNNWIGEGLIVPDPSNPADQVYSVNNTGAKLVTYLPLTTVIPEGTTATLFFRFRSSDNVGLADWVVGASDVVAPVDWPDYEGYVRISEDGTVGDIDLDARNGGGFTEVGGVTSDTWINVWLVLDNSNDTTDVYFNTSATDATNPGTLSLLGAGFRNGTTDDLITLLAINNEVNSNAYIDDIYLDTTGENLTHPFATDGDGDGMTDQWERNFFTDTSRDGSGDFDNDNLTDLEEFQAGTNPTLKDSDGDTIDDDVELSGSANTFDNAPTNPILADSDNDGFNDDIEIAGGSNPNDVTSLPPRPSGFQLVEDFQGDGMVVGQTFSGVNGWTTNQTASLSIQPAFEGSSDLVGTITQNTDPGTSISLSKSLTDLRLDILEGQTGTLFLQIASSSANLDSSFGLSDVLNPLAFADFEAQSVLFPGNLIRIRDAETFRDQATFAVDTWMNVWIVSDNENDLVNIYYESPDGQSGQVEVTDDGGIDPFNFRNGTTEALSTVFIVLANNAEAGSTLLIDNIYLDADARNLTTPALAKGASATPNITSSSFNENGDLLLTFTPGGSGFTVTSSNDLTTPFEEQAGTAFDNADTFIIPAVNLTGGKKFFRIEKQ
ncbi:hypothetical protein V2O64_11205 [Verrucomicrobiaceae bacterium 227]